MRLAILVFTAAALLCAQRAGQLVVRSVSVSDPGGPRDTFADLQKAWTDRGVKLGIEEGVPAADFGSRIALAAQAIEQHYCVRGRSVSVGYEVEPLPPRAVGVRFRVIDNRNKSC